MNALLRALLHYLSTCPQDPYALGFRLYINTSYAALTATSLRYYTFVSSTHDALVIAFTRPLTPGITNATREVEINIHTTFASAWPDATQSMSYSYQC